MTQSFIYGQELLSLKVNRDLVGNMTIDSKSSFMERSVLSSVKIGNSRVKGMSLAPKMLFHSDLKVKHI